MTVAREEIFGPVVSVITFRDEADAVRIANDTPYGLSGLAVDARRRPPAAGGPGASHRRAGREHELVACSCRRRSAATSSRAIGKELGMEALAHNTELKSVFISTE